MHFSCTRKVIVFLNLVAGIGTFTGCANSWTRELGASPEDADITAAVEARFSQHPVLEPPTLLSVQTHNHIVYLYGVVDTALERDIAESVARETPGVTKVIDSIGLSGNR